MKVLRRIPGLVALSSIFFLTNTFGCMGGANTGTTTNELPATISITPTPASLAVNSVTTFTAVTTNATGYSPYWTILDTGSVSGSITPSSGATMTYTAPSAPPIYGFESGYADGTVEISASVENVAGCDDVYAYSTFTVTAPSVTTGLTATSTSVALGSSTTLTGYAVGSTNLGMTLQVNGVTGGSTATGTIAAVTGYPNTYTYTAPSAMPMTGSTVTLTLISQADPTKSSTVVIALH